MGLSAKPQPQAVVCSCGREAELRSGRDVYPHRPDLFGLWTWVCRPCDARVGCRRGTQTPLGTLAGPRLRKARSEAHSAFDPLWQSGLMSRSAAYAWLGGRLGLTPELCHIGRMDERDCRRTVEAVSALRDSL